MSETVNYLVIIVASMFVGATLAYMHMFRVLLKSEKKQELRIIALGEAFDMLGMPGDIRDLDKALEKHFADQ
jgi:hypothetical protein